jgi:hypothetical protein
LTAGVGDLHALIPVETQKQYQALKSRGYTLPWFGGYLFADVWMVRGLWYSLSSEGMLLVTDVEGNSVVPGHIGRLPLGKMKGALSQRVKGLRIANECANLTALELLRSADRPLATTQTTSIMRPLKFTNLVQSMAFLNILAKPNTSNKLLSTPRLLNAVNTVDPFLKVDAGIITEVIASMSAYFHLNEDQRSVLRQVGSWFSHDSDGDVVLVHGIFGSGKSHLLTSIVQLLSLLSNNLVKCLISANTNVAVDRILLQLVDVLGSDSWRLAIGALSRGPGTDAAAVLRVGSVARVDRALRRHLCLQSETSAAAKNDLTRTAKIDMDPYLRELLVEASKTDFVQKQKRRLASATVVGTTCASAASPLLLDSFFEVLIVDEASQISEPISLLPLACARPRKLIIVGDPLQLPPITSERRGSVSLMQTTLFDRLKLNRWPCIMLKTQYRCHPEIADICNRLFYDNKIIHGVGEEQRPAMLTALPAVGHVINLTREERRGSSYVNLGEANIVKKVVKRLLESGSGSVGVICFYKAQVSVVVSAIAPLLDAFLNEARRVRVSTIDSFQGQESDSILLLTTRAQDSCFLSDTLRVNVAISRARHHLLLVLQESLLESSGLWASISASSVCLDKM